MTKDVRILVVEDEPKLAAAVQQALEGDDYTVQVAHSGEDGFYLAQTERFDLLILDVMLPGRDGFEILGALRGHDIATPVLMLTARDAVEDRVRGLDSGADDYLVKPFALPELLARARALLRRNKGEPASTLRLGTLQMDVVRRTVTRDGRSLDLTAREFDLLEYLLRHSGRVVSRDMLARDVWKTGMRYTPLDNVIDVHVARLRRKLDDPFDETLLHTVRGVGFVLRQEGEPA
jgi:DNA-binding response OmpR family regulator